MTRDQRSAFARLTAVVALMASARCQAQDRAYVVNNFASSVSVVAGETGTVVKTIGFSPEEELNEIAAVSNGYIYVAVSGEQNAVAVIDPASLTVTKRIPLALSPIRLAGSPDGTRLYVLGGEMRARRIVAIETASARIAESIPVPADTYDIEPSGQIIYLTEQEQGAIVALNLVSKEVVFRAQLPQGRLPRDLALSQDGAHLYASVAVPGGPEGEVVAVDAQDGSVTHTFAVGVAPCGIAVSGNDSTVYVANFSSDSVSIIATSSMLVTSIAVGQGPTDVGLGQGAGHLYVSNTDSDSVSLIDVHHLNEPTITAPVGEMPTFLTVTDAAFGTPTAAETSPTPVPTLGPAIVHGGDGCSTVDPRTGAWAWLLPVVFAVARFVAGATEGR